MVVTSIPHQVVQADHGGLHVGQSFYQDPGLGCVLPTGILVFREVVESEKISCVKFLQWKKNVRKSKGTYQCIALLF